MSERLKGNDRETTPAPGAGEDDPFERQKQAWQGQKFLTQVLNAVQESILVLNSSQQIVFANAAVLSRLKVDGAAGLDGKRWGDALGCRHATAGGGCGVARFCKACGGLKAIETGLRGTNDVQECRILTRDGEAMDLLVTAVPLDLGADRYLICTLADISAQKRRRVLERLFFHDVLNTAAGVKGLADMLMEAEGAQAAEIRGMIVTTAATLMEQIQGQRLLTVAENKELHVSVQPIDSLDFLRDMLAKWQAEGKARHLRLVVNADSKPVRFSSDITILSHVMNSMMRNAFEASSRGMEISLGCYAEDQAVVFRVRNSTVLAEDVQLQMFQRSFSTKGSGRGQGTYSMKLLTEQYLGGTVGVSSGGSDGTMFYVRLPLTPPGAPQA